MRWTVGLEMFASSCLLVYDGLSMIGKYDCDLNIIRLMYLATVFGGKSCRNNFLCQFSVLNDPYTKYSQKVSYDCFSSTLESTPTKKITNQCGNWEIVIKSQGQLVEEQPG